MLGAGRAFCDGRTVRADGGLYPRPLAREISVYDYTQVLFSALFGFFMFGQIPDALSVVGYIVICGASVALFVYNRRNAAK